jgi:hypothetical protein
MQPASHDEDTGVVLSVPTLTNRYRARLRLQRRGLRRARVSARRRYSKRTLPGLVMRRSSGSVTVMTPNAMTRPVPISA